MRNNSDLFLRLLFGQLTWPSALVRERAATAIARLFLAGSDRVEALLLQWLREQLLESVSLHGLLALIRVQIDGGSVPRSDVLLPAISRPSLLSRMLCEELYGSDCVPVETCLIHSGSPPQSFVVRPFFEEHDESFLPSIYAIHARRLEKRFAIPFQRQWGYEWQLLVESTRARLSTEPLRFWQAGGRPEGHYRYAAADTRLGEVYRSAFIRALHWSVQMGFIPLGLASFIAADACPINLSLWKVVPQRRPQWWPTPAEAAGSIDTTAEQVWRHVHALWDKQSAKQRWSEEPVGGDEMLVGASGFISEVETKYHLDIVGAFQSCEGPDSPDADRIASWVLDETSVRASQARFRALLHFDGALEGNEKPEFDRVADWRIGRAICVANANTRWQFWRMWSPIHLLCPDVLGSRGSFSCLRDVILFRNAVGDPVGRWSDWTDGLHEEVVDEVPPRSGQVLRAPRSVIESFAAATDTTFCWICRLTAFSQKATYEAHRAVHLNQVFGATRIVR